MNVAAVIVTHNGAATIAQCVESLQRSAVPPPVVVVDNASTDDTVARVKELGVSAVVTNGRNLGFGRACNEGMRRALDSGAWAVFLLNQDACVEPDTLGLLAAAAERHREYGVLSPVHEDGEGTDLDARFRQYMAEGAPSFLADRDGQRVAEVYPVPFVNAAAWLVTRPALERVGGFDPVFFLYGEDVDYCRRCALHALRVGVVPSAHARHLRDNDGGKPTAQRRRHKALAVMLGALRGSERGYPVESLRQLYGGARAAVAAASRGDGCGARAQLAAAALFAVRSLPAHRNWSGCREPGSHWLGRS